MSVQYGRRWKSFGSVFILAVAYSSCPEDKLEWVSSLTSELAEPMETTCNNILEHYLSAVGAGVEGLVFATRDAREFSHHCFD